MYIYIRMIHTYAAADEEHAQAQKQQQQQRQPEQRQPEQRQPEQRQPEQRQPEQRQPEQILFSRNVRPMARMRSANRVVPSRRQYEIMSYRMRHHNTIT